MDLRKIIEDIQSDRIKKVIIDTDTNNEVDDQFAIAYALGSEKVDLLSLNAAPFFNQNSSSFENGMEKSYDEIKRVLAAYRDDCDIPVFEQAFQCPGRTESCAGAGRSAAFGTGGSRS